MAMHAAGPPKEMPRGYFGPRQTSFYNPFIEMPDAWPAHLHEVNVQPHGVPVRLRSSSSVSVDWDMGGGSIDSFEEDRVTHADLRASPDTLYTPSLISSPADPDAWSARNSSPDSGSLSSPERDDGLRRWRELREATRTPALRGEDGGESTPPLADSLNELSTIRDENLAKLAKMGLIEYDDRFVITKVHSNGLFAVPPNEVRFTQGSASYYSFNKMYTIDSNAKLVAKDPKRLPEIDVVVMPDGGLTSLDNRRLASARLSNAKEVYIRLHGFDDPLPTADRIKTLSWYDRSRKELLAPVTWGDAANIRMAKTVTLRGGEGFEAYQFGGSDQIPLLRGVPSHSALAGKFTTPPARRASESVSTLSRRNSVSTVG